MMTEKRTPPGATDGAQTCVGVRPCGPHVHKDTHPRREDKPKLRPRSARSLPAVSRYRPGSDYRPPEEALARRQREVLDLLKERGSRGATRLDAPPYACRSETRRFRETDVRHRKAAVVLGLRAFVSLVSLVSAK